MLASASTRWPPSKAKTQSNRGRIERYHDQIKAFFDNIGHKRTTISHSRRTLLHPRADVAPLCAWRFVVDCLDAALPQSLDVVLHGLQPFGGVTVPIRDLAYDP